MLTKEQVDIRRVDDPIDETDLKFKFIYTNVSKMLEILADRL